MSISVIFKTTTQHPIERNASEHPFHSRSTLVPKTSPMHITNLEPVHDGTGAAKLLITTDPSVTSHTFHSLRSLPSTQERLRRPQERIIQKGTVWSSFHSLLGSPRFKPKTLRRYPLPRRNGSIKLRSIATELKSEVGRLELRLNAACLLNTEVGFLSEDLVSLTYRVGTVEDELARISTITKEILS